MDRIEPEIRNIEAVLLNIEVLVKTPGYIYSLLLIIFEDFHVDPENLHNLDNHNRLNMNEASLILGFLIKEPINLSHPESFKILFENKRKTYELMAELHSAFHIPFFERLETEMKLGQSDKMDTQHFFGSGQLLIEPIFYAGTGVYDFQYLDFLEEKYKYDSDWLMTNKGFVIAEAGEIFKTLKSYLQKKSEQVNLYVSRELPGRKEDARKTYKGTNFEKDYQEIVDMAELHQYASLFFDESIDSSDIKNEKFRQDSHKAFYKNLINLFTIPKEFILRLAGGKSFADNFSVKAGSHIAKNFQGIGSYNVTKSHPLLELDDEKFLIPISFILAEAIYESPYYWMGQDKVYEKTASSNRGNVGEDISYNFLSRIFGKNAKKRITVKSSKRRIDTDVDVLCILGSKALCVQVKSKKLTELSRKGDDEQLKKDFQGAVQDAYDQAWIARKKILDRSSKFYDENNNELKLSEEIDEVYMLIITTENFPSLTHQTQNLIQLKENSPYPIALSVFDLETVAHYLPEPYEFLYYIRQRINLSKYFHGDEEMTYLGYHLTKKLWKPEDADFIALDYSQAQIIDRNYFPYRAGIKVSDDGDIIKSSWKDDKFDLLCRQIKSSSEAKVTDIIFSLYDLSGHARTELVKNMIETKQKTWSDGEFHNFALPPDHSYEPRFGITYFSSETDSLEEVKKRLFVLCSLRKYKCKAQQWLGLGSIKNSRAPFDLLFYSDSVWEYDALLEEHSKHLPEVSPVKKSLHKRFKNIGRNNPCPCGSGKKFKRCCVNK